MSKTKKKKDKGLPLNRWHYFFKTLYHNASATTEFTYDRVIYRKSEELQEIETRSGRIHIMLLVLLMAMFALVARIHNVWIVIIYMVLVTAGEIVRYCMLPKDIKAHLTDTGKRAKLR
jgi:general stress protein CsbA